MLRSIERAQPEGREVNHTLSANCAQIQAAAKKGATAQHSVVNLTDSLAGWVSRLRFLLPSASSQSALAINSNKLCPAHHCPEPRHLAARQHQHADQDDADTDQLLYRQHFAKQIPRRERIDDVAKR